MHFHSAQDMTQEVNAFLDEANALQLNPVSEKAVRKGRRVGAGTFSVVSEAFLKTEDKKKRDDIVALKELRSDRHDFDLQRKQLAAEASVLARLQHPNILRYIGCGVACRAGQPIPFMIQEYLAGGSLDEYISRLRRRRISYDPRYSYSLAAALRWAKQVRCLMYMVMMMM